MRAPTGPDRTFLLSCDKETLVSLLVEAAHADARFEERLRQLKLRSEGKPTDLARYREMIVRACHVERFVEYKHVAEFARRIEWSLQPINQMMEDGQSREALELIDFAIPHVSAAFANCHDDLLQVSAILERLSEHHLAACRSADPDAQHLARIIFEREQQDPSDLFSGLVEKYAAILGPGGMEAYESHLRSAWAQLPVVKDLYGTDGGRFNLERMANAFSGVTGRPGIAAELKAAFVDRQKREIPRLEREVHALVKASKQRDYQRAVDLLKQIAQILREAAAESEWTSLLDRVRARHSRKSAFIRQLHFLYPPGS